MNHLTFLLPAGADDLSPRADLPRTQASFANQPISVSLETTTGKAVTRSLHGLVAYMLATPEYKAETITGSRYDLEDRIAAIVLGVARPRGQDGETGVPVISRLLGANAAGTGQFLPGHEGETECNGGAR